MYIRRTTRTLADGQRVGYLQLAHKVRDPETGVPKDKILYHFGREEELDRDQLKRLVKSLTRFLEPEDRVPVQARLEGFEDIVVERSLPYGGSYFLDRVWRRLELDTVLHELLEEREYDIDVERLLFAMVANRALDPRSKLAIERWVGQHVAIDGLEEAQVHQLYRAMDFLLEHAEEIQKRVFFSTATLLNLEVDLLFFDTTTAYFEIEEPDEEEEGLRRFGRPSKDHRPDLPQVVIGLAVTRSGIPVRCWAWPGNTADAAVVDQVQADMADWKLSRVVWVVDRGMAGSKQRIQFQRGGGHVIVGERMRSGEKVIEDVLSTPGRYQRVRDNLEVKEVVIEEGSLTRRFVIVRNPEQAERDRRIREAQLERLEAEIERLNERLRKRDDETPAHTKAVCALKADPNVGRYIRELKSGELRINKGAVRDEERLDGKYVISTTDPSLTSEDIALGYKQLAEVERAFRDLKHTLDLRPLYHRVPDRIRAHVLLCWLALLLVRVIETETDHTWSQVRHLLQQVHQVDFSTKDGRLRMVSELTADQRLPLGRMKIPVPKNVQEARLNPA